MFSTGTTFTQPKTLGLSSSLTSWNQDTGAHSPFTVSHYDKPSPDSCTTTSVKPWNSRETTTLVAAIDTLAIVDAQLVNWKYFSSLVLETEDFLKYKSFIDWTIASTNIDIDTALQFRECVDWRVFLQTHANVDIGKLKDVALDWNDVLTTQSLTEAQIVQNMHRMDIQPHRESRRLWKTLCTYQTLSEQFMMRFWSRLDKKRIAQYQKLSYKFILRYIKELDRNIVCVCQELTPSQVATLTA